MRKAWLTRLLARDEGTFGTFFSDQHFSCKSGELPWRDLNQDGIGDPETSCISHGLYLCTWKTSPKFGPCYHVENVKGRTGILIHAANYMGDTSKSVGEPPKKLKSDVRGCIALGRAIAPIAGQLGITSSRETVQAMEEHFKREDFELHVVDLITPMRTRGKP